MNATVAAVEPNGDKVEPVQRDTPGDSPPPAGRFIYVSGDQPLSGYTIKRGIGHGGFGEVYYAVSDGGKEVALKLVRRNFDVELRGIRHCLNLKHPNLLSVFDLRQDSHGDHWVVMEHVSGESLERMLAANPNGLPLEQALAWFHGIAAGVACLHDHGIVHRDLKPANLFSEDGQVKVGDYGLSKFISCSRRSGHTESVGTVHYMAPEIANGRYGKEIDIYALGVLLYEMLTGRVPFEGESVGEVLMKHLMSPPNLTGVAEPYRSVIAKALEKDPAQRFNSVGAMVAALPGAREPIVLATALPLARPSALAATMPGPGEASRGGRLADEPVYRFVSRACRGIGDAWHQAPLNKPAKIAVLVIGLVALCVSAPAVFPIAWVLLWAYGFYLFVRWIVGMVLKKPAGRSADPPLVLATAAPVMPLGPGRKAKSPRQRAEEALALKPLRNKTAELFGSLVGGALVTLAMTVVMILVNGYRGVEPRLEQAAWLALVGILASWAVLVPSKIWEGAAGDGMVRAFILMVIGLGVGGAAFLVARLFHVDILPDPRPGFGPRFALPTLVGPGGQPLPIAFAAAFGALFLVIRWWRQADPLRIARLSIWTVAGCVVLAWMIAESLQFPAAWLMMIACIMSVSVQLASPWAAVEQ